MTTITELEALATAAMSPAPYERAQGQAGLIAAGIMQNILALIALVRQMKTALEYNQINWLLKDEALAAFENFGAEK